MYKQILLHGPLDLSCIELIIAWQEAPGNPDLGNNCPVQMLSYLVRTLNNQSATSGTACIVRRLPEQSQVAL